MATSVNEEVFVEQEQTRWEQVRGYIGKAAAIGAGALALAGCMPVCETAEDNVTVDAGETGVDFLSDINGVVLEGASVQGTSLRLHDIDRRIHNYNDGNNGQNGDYQLNIPMLLTQHATVEGNGSFDVEADIALDPGANTTLFVGARTPWVFDDFRVDQGVQLTISANQLSYSVHDGNHTDDFPSSSGTVALSNTSNQKEVVIRNTPGMQTQTIINGQTINVPGVNPFTTNEVVLGAQADNGEAMLQNLRVTGNVTQLVNTKDFDVCETCPDGLADIARANNRPGVGMAIATPAYFGSDRRYAMQAIENSTVVTPENALKMQNLQPKPGVFTFEEADAVVDSLRRNGADVHGHTLLWHRGLPEYVSNFPTNTAQEKALVRAYALDYIHTVVDHFKGRVQSWDVINEIMANNNSPAIGPWRETVWLKAWNGDINAMITDVFNAAHAADPMAKLWVNDFAIDKEGFYFGGSNTTAFGDDARFRPLLIKLDELQNNGVPITGIGSQGHVYDRPRDDSDPADCELVNAGLNLYRGGIGCRIDEAEDRGLKFRISEMDVTPWYQQPDGSYALDLQAQAVLYHQIARACVIRTNCESFQVWGVGGPNTSTVNIDPGGVVRPQSHVIFNENMGVVTGVYDALQFAYRNPDAEV